VSFNRVAKLYAVKRLIPFILWKIEDGGLGALARPSSDAFLLFR
jgi:hypothetical protein